MLVLSAFLGAQLVFAWAASAHAEPIPGLFNTGVNDAGTPLAGGSVDPHYSLIQSADPAYPGPDAIVAEPIRTPFG
jgi:hypothetical protein